MASLSVRLARLERNLKGRRPERPFLIVIERAEPGEVTDGQYTESRLSDGHIIRRYGAGTLPVQLGTLTYDENGTMLIARDLYDLV